MLELHTFFRSSAAYRVRIALHLKGLEYTAVPVRFASREQRGASYRRVNPQGLVPTLVHDGEVLTQSLAIVEYLDARFPEPRLIPAEPLARARVQAFAQVIACDTHPLNNLRVLDYLRTELALDEPAVGRWYRHWIAESLAACETLARAHGGGCCYGDEVTLADACLVPQLYNARRFACDLAPYPCLVAIDERLGSVAAFARAAPESQPDCPRDPD